MSHHGKPNILWICTDQQRWDTLGCYGNERVNTPNIDRLAANGVVFDRCYSQSPVCTPSRAGFLTGRYPRTTRCRQNGQDMPADEVLVTRLLADSGYTCGLSGKLHIAACNPSVTPDIEPRINDGYSSFRWSHHAGFDWPFNDYGRWLRKQGVTFKTPVSQHSQHVRIGMPRERHQTTWCVSEAIDFIDAVEQFDAPWCFSVNMFDPHHAFDPPEQYLERYLSEIDDVPLPNYRPGDLDDKSVFHRIDHGAAYNTSGSFPFDEMSERDHRVVRAAYWAMVDLIDDEVGRLLRFLDERGLTENTVVIFTSDHGEMLGDHGVYLKGPYFYDAAVRVPMIISRGSAFPAGRAGGLIELNDIAPTILEACGLPPHDGMQARSFYRMLTGDADRAEFRSDVYSEYYNAMPWHRNPLPYATMVRNERHKLVRYHGLREGELYDMKKDPAENVNLWSDPDSRDVKLSLLELMTDRMAFTVDPLPARKAPW